MTTEIVLALLTFILAVVGWLFRGMHSQAMERLDNVVAAVNKMAVNDATNTVKHEQNVKDISRIDEHNKMQDKTIYENRDSLHKIKNTMVTQEHLRELSKH